MYVMLVTSVYDGDHSISHNSVQKRCKECKSLGSSRNSTQRPNKRSPKLTTTESLQLARLVRLLLRELQR
jgi:hypothetical protein